MSPASSPLVLLFCKYPEPGHVKTRLARSTSHSRACALYSAFVTDCLASLDALRAHVVCLVDPYRPLADYHRWLKGRIIRPQRGNDLGERMANALAQALEHSDRALLMGTDVPHLPDHVLSDAWQRLRTRDMVLGPARDGGYYLIGMRRQGYTREFTRSVFQGIPWSTRHVLDLTLGRAAKAGLRTSLLPTLRDVDTTSDLDALLRSTASAPATRRTAWSLGLQTER